MAREKRHSTPGVTEFLGDCPQAWDFFQAVRRLEALCPDSPRVGDSAHAEQDPVRFCQEPSLAFPPTAISRVQGRADDGLPDRLFVYFLGLLGCSGPMPLHFTEYVYSRERQAGDATWARFLDVFNHRMISFFYRAWAESRQAVSFDRGGDDRFGGYVASLAGIGMPSLRDRDAVPDVAKLHYSGRLLCPTGSAESLCAVLADYFRVPVDIEQFVGQWIPIPKEDRCRLGESLSTGELGRTIVVGKRVWDCQHRFRLVVGPMRLADYLRMLPGAGGLKRMRDWIRGLAGCHLQWDAQLILKADEVPDLVLGGAAGARLGYTTWLHTRPFAQDVADLHVGTS